jgi:hypothetical protein
LLSEPRTIHFMTELQVLPVKELAIPPEALRKLYTKLFDAGQYRYDNCDLQASPPTLTTRRESGQSMCQIGAHVIRLIESKPAMPSDEFEGVARTVLTALAQCGGVEPVFYVQRTRIQCLAQPHTHNALFLLAGRVANVIAKVEPFGRPPGLFGIRFRFLPYDGPQEEGDGEGDPTAEVEAASEAATDQSEEYDEPFKEPAEGFVSVRMEMYEEDPSQILIEVSCVHPFTEPITLGDLDKICANIRDTHSFVLEKCKRFLDQFDNNDDEGDEEDDL